MCSAEHSSKFPFSTTSAMQDHTCEPRTKPMPPENVNTSGVTMDEYTCNNGTLALVLRKGNKIVPTWWSGSGPLRVNKVDGSYAHIEVAGELYRAMHRTHSEHTKLLHGTDISPMVTVPQDPGGVPTVRILTHGSRNCLFKTGDVLTNWELHMLAYQMVGHRFVPIITLTKAKITRDGVWSTDYTSRTRRRLGMGGHTKHKICGHVRKLPAKLALKNRA
mgnify:CR=1 FL=1